ncbi:MAG: site-2 protease family protein, partial [Beijerinckiaceae bacterium]|nr:site-2 protease family protein [Beijerinckiaceae bacterium]
MSLMPSFGSFLWTVVAFVVALSVIVAVHEFGHYIVARWCGIRSEVFSIGFGPRLWSRVDRNGTRWQIAALPFGGYVKFLGDANAASSGADAAVLSRLSESERRRTMHGAPLWARSATVAAGPVFNFLLSVIVFAGLFLWQGVAIEQPTVGTIGALPGAAAEVQPGDRILSVGGIDTPDYEALMDAGAALPPAASYDYRVL